MSVIAYSRRTPAAEMRRNRQARRVECNGALACMCGSRCPMCGTTAHINLGRSSDGRRLRCAGCGAEFTGPDMFRVLARDGFEPHFIGVLCGRMLCTCASRHGHCWHRDRVGDYLQREAARQPQPSPARDEATAEDVFAMLDPGDYRTAPKFRVVQ